MKELILIGFWRSKEEPDWPDPAWFVDLSWDKNERDYIAKYLNNAQTMLIKK